MGDVAAGAVIVGRDPDTAFLPRRFAARYPRYMDNAVLCIPSTAAVYLASRRSCAYPRIGASGRLFRQKENWTNRIESIVGSCPRLTHPGYRLDSGLAHGRRRGHAIAWGMGPAPSVPVVRDVPLAHLWAVLRPGIRGLQRPRMPAGGLPRRHDGPPAARRWEVHCRRSRRVRWPPVGPSCWRGSRRA